MTTSEATGEAVLVMTTVGSEDAARELSRALVGEGLAACVTRSAVRSVYRWEDTPAGEPARAVREMPLCEDEELLLLIKTARRRLPELEKRLLELHAYALPELVVLAPERVEPRYLRWLLEACA